MSEHEQVREDIYRLSTLVTGNNTEVVQRLTTIETQMKSLIGNGQPGRISLLEQSMARSEKFRNQAIGYASAVSTLVSGLWIVASYFFNHIKR